LQVQAEAVFQPRQKVLIDSFDGLRRTGGDGLELGEEEGKDQESQQADDQRQHTQHEQHRGSSRQAEAGQAVGRGVGDIGQNAGQQKGGENAGQRMEGDQQHRQGGDPEHGMQAIGWG
jgi:hypothetical protein